MTTLLKNGTLITASETFEADMLIEGEQIELIGRNLQHPNAEIIDAAGKLILPGGIDPHVHLDLPMFGTVSSDDHYTGHKTAAFGGTTTVMDFVVLEKEGFQHFVELWFITMIAGSSLIDIFFGAVFFMFSSSLPESIIMNHIETPISLDTPLWLQGILFLLECGIPVFFLLILGLKLMINNLKSIGTVAKLTLLATWIIATAFTVYLGVKESMIMNYSGKNIKKEMLTIKPNDTLFVKFKTNDFYSKDVTEKTSYDFTQDETKKNVIYSNNVSLEVLSTDEKTAYLQIEKYAVGTTASLANNRAESMKYKFNFDGKKLILDNYFISEMIHKSRNQEVKLYLKVLDGYAPFSKLHVHRNWTSTRCLTVPITDANRHLLRSDYEARNSAELPVLVRWFEGIEPPIADYLVVILYARAQMAKEGTPIDADWGIVGCMYTSEPDEIPMAPITMLRNALGIDEGGSGLAIDRAAHARSVEFWRTHANWR